MIGMLALTITQAGVFLEQTAAADWLFQQMLPVQLTVSGSLTKHVGHAPLSGKFCV